MSVPFGSEVTEALLRAMPRYRGRDIKQDDLAREATRLIQATGKNMEALQHVVALRSRFGSGCCTLCLIYNATGTTLDLVQPHNWSGRIYQQQPPRRVRNGQWISFLHVSDGRRTNSSGALIFRGTNMKDVTRDFLVAWKTPHNEGCTVLTQIRESGHFPGRWGPIYDSLEKSRKINEDTSDADFTSSISIGGVNNPEYIAVLQHKFEPLPDEL